MPELGSLMFGDRNDPNEQLEKLFGAGNQQAEQEALKAAVVWGRKVIADAGITVDQQVRAIKALRDAEPRLTLRPATQLAKLLKDN